MPLFWIMFNSLVFGIVLVLVLGVWFYQRRSHGLDSGLSAGDDAAAQREKRNVWLFRQKQAELNEQLELGEIDPQSYAALLEENKQQLVFDVNKNFIKQDVKNKISSNLEKIVLYFVILCIPAIALLLYLPAGLSLGASDQIAIKNQLEQLRYTETPNEKNIQLLRLIDVLEQQTVSLLPDPALQNMLAELYLNLQRYDDALQVYTQLYQRDRENVSVIVQLAEVYYRRAVESVSAEDAAQMAFPAEASKLLKRALALDSQHPYALGLAGIEAFQNQQWQQAIDYWQVALSNWSSDSGQIRMLEGGIRAAKKRLGIVDEAAAANQSTPGKLTGAVVRLSIAIDQSLLTASDSPDTPVFIFARPANGSRMPLAARRLTLADLPVEFALTDRDTMSGQSIAEHESVIVAARLARSGQAIATAGDIESNELEVQVQRGDVQEAQSTSLLISRLRN